MTMHTSSGPLLAVSFDGTAVSLDSRAALSNFGNRKFKRNYMWEYVKKG
jgi:hypothetical protein